MRIHLKSSELGMSCRWIAAGVVMLGMSIPANSMDLLQAYQAAQRNDATILAARATGAADLEVLPQARAQLMPSITASMSRNNNWLTSVSPNFFGEDQTTETSYPSENQTLTLRQPLFRPQLMAQYRQARAQVQDSAAVMEQEEQNLFVRVSNAYFDALLSHEQLALVMAQQTAYTTQLEVARKAFAAGSGTRTDEDEALSRLDMNLALEVEARQNVSYTLQQLQTLVGEPVGEVAKLNVANLKLQPPQPNSLEDWSARAINNSPQIQSLLARVNVAREEVNKAKSGHYPTLDAIVQWSNSKSESITNTASSYTNKSIGLQLNVPLFAGGYVNSLVRQTLKRQERAEQILEAGRRDLEMRVYKEFRGVTEGIPRIRALEQALRSSDQLVVSSNKSFQAGSRTVLDILNAEQQRMLVLRDLAQARYQYLLSKVRLSVVAGLVDVDVVTSMNQALQP